MSSNIIGYKNCWSHSHQEHFGQINRGILGTCGNQYCTSTAFILRRGLVDGSEARLISCWDRCCNLTGRFVVVKAASVISREEVLGRGLELNLGEG